MIDQTWKNFLTVVQHELGSRAVDTWFKAIELVRWDARQKMVYMRAPNNFVQEWVTTHYMSIFHVHLARLFGVDTIRVLFIDRDDNQAAIVPARLVLNEPELDVQKNQPMHTTYQFETFVVGPSNSLSYAAAQAVTEKPGLVYNPLFLYGHSGLGKTHLLHAIGNAIKQRFKKFTVLYQPADRFVNEFIHAIRYDKVDIFKEKYKKIDVLLIDDIQFMAHKDQTQEAFFHVFNALHESSKQIVCSSDTYPRDLRGIAERLRSRLEWGLVTDMQVPTFEEKVAIIKRKALIAGHELTNDVAEFIAQQTTNNVRELEGAFIRVCACACLTKQAITVSLAQKVLVRPVILTHKKTITLDLVAGLVAKHYGYSITDLRSPARNKNIAFARHVAMFLMKRLTSRSLHDIGSFLRRNDHTTVTHAIDKVDQLIVRDQALHNTINAIEKQIRRL